MNQQRFVNNFSALLAAAASAGATSISISAAQAALLPALNNGDYVIFTLTQPGAGSAETSWEQVTVTAVNPSTGLMTCSPLQNAWASGSKCDIRIPAATLEALTQLLSRSSPIAGSRSLTSADSGATLVYSGSSDITLTYPSGLGANFSCTVAELGSGKVKTQPGSGVTAGNVGQTSGPGSIMTITAVAADSYAVQNPVSNGQTLLGVSAIPFIVFASGSWTAAANGVVTVPAQTTAWPYAYVYMPANSVTANNPAGWYFGVFSSTTSVTLYNNVYNVATGGTPVIPASPTAFAVSAGSNTTQDTMPIQGPTFTIPGGALGNNGAIQLSAQMQASLSTNTKTLAFGLGSVNNVFATLNSVSQSSYGEADAVIQNLAQQTRQMFRGKNNGGQTAAPVILTQDTTANIGTTVNMNCGTVANDWVILHYCRFMTQYGA